MWNYNAETGMIEINITNPIHNNTITWKTGEDSFKIIYLYELDKELDKQIVNLKAETNIKPYTRAEVTSKEEKQIELQQPMGSVANFIAEATTSVNKGYLYANSTYETPYTTKWTAEISYAQAVDKITMEQNNDVFVLENGNQIDSGNNTYYQSTKIKKEIFDKILGSQGIIEIFSQDGTKLARIDAASSVDANGDIIIYYTGTEVNNIKVVTYKPIAEGKLIIENNKAIKSITEYDFNTKRQMNTIITNVTGTAFLAEEINSQETKNAQITMNPTITKAQLSVNNQNLSTVVKNENVQLKVILQADNSQLDLYKNPVLEIELPSEVTEVNIKSIDVLFSDEVKI